MQDLILENPMQTQWLCEEDRGDTLNTGPDELESCIETILLPFNGLWAIQFLTEPTAHDWGDIEGNIWKQKYCSREANALDLVMI